jgi:hypothetical protein
MGTESHSSFPTRDSRNVGFGMSARRNGLNVVTAKVDVSLLSHGHKRHGSDHARIIFENARHGANPGCSSTFPLRRYANQRMKKHRRSIFSMQRSLYCSNVKFARLATSDHILISSSIDL